MGIWVGRGKVVAYQVIAELEGTKGADEDQENQVRGHMAGKLPWAARAGHVPRVFGFSSFRVLERSRVDVLDVLEKGDGEVFQLSLLTNYPSTVWCSREGEEGMAQWFINIDAMFNDTGIRFFAVGNNKHGKSNRISLIRIGGVEGI